ncbi:hypothetical protein [Nocardioides sp. NPDC127503]
MNDAEPNVLGARALGMQAIQHTDPECTRATLAGLVPLSPTPPGVNT